MKNLIIIILSVLGFAACMGTKKATVKVSFPPNMNETVRAGYLDMWNKGHILYELNCAKCHTKVVNRREVIPEFTEEQLQTYEVRLADSTHEIAVSEMRVTPEELSYITLFLTYRERDTTEYNRVLARPRTHDHN
jgi:hypothetical protein